MSMSDKNKYKYYTDNNYSLWNGRANPHFKSEFYDVEGFKEGKTSLSSIELEELGNVKEKSLLHLQCHFGQDTLSWARRGACVTGVDFSDSAIRIANSLSQQLNIPADFICADIYNLPNILKSKFDIVFTSYGVLKWLHNIQQWAEIVEFYLKPGGTFYLIEFHPFIYILDYELAEKISHSYFYNEEPICYEEIGSYAVPSSERTHTAYAWSHTISEVINALLSTGLQLEFIHEFPFSTINCFPFVIEGEQGKYIHKKYPNMIPMLYSIKAIKQK